MTRDDTFGPTGMFGTAGIFLERLRDITFRVTPVTRRGACEMARQIEGCSVLNEVAGQRAPHIDALADTIGKVAILTPEHSEMRELDLNPVLAFESGASIVDARVILR